MSTGPGKAKPGPGNPRALRAASQRRSEAGTSYADGGWYRVRTGAGGTTEILYKVAELGAHPDDVRPAKAPGEGGVVVTFHFLETDEEEGAVLAALQRGDVRAALAVTR